MKTIYKYPVHVTDCQWLTLPYDAVILTVQKQADDFYIWAEVNDGHGTKDVPIYTYGTGHEIPAGRKQTYIGTVQDGPLVWHFYLGV